MKIERALLSELSFYKGNARKHNEKQIGLLVKSIGLFGQYRPMVVLLSSKEVLVGNALLEALRLMKFEYGDVVYVDISDDKANELSLIDNRSSELSEWDNNALADLLYKFSDEELGFVGYSGEDLSGFLDSVVQEEETINAVLSEKTEIVEKSEVVVKYVCTGCGTEYNVNELK